MTLLLWCAFIASLLGHHLLAAWLPTVLVGTGVSLGVAASAGGLLHAGGGIGGVVLGRMLDKRGAVALVIAYVLAAPCTLLIARAGGATSLLVVAFLTGFTLIGAHVGLTALSGSFYPTFIRSTGTGWSFGVGRIGSIIGPLVGGALMSMHVSTLWVLTAAAIPALCAALATHFLSKTPAAVRQRSAG
jgi:AAHS family 4-hydroxybenzoate transporter-like MFS transporter